MLKVRLLNPKAKLPRYAHKTDAGMDLYLTEDIKLKPYERVKIVLGISIELPKNTVGLILEKGSRGNEGLKLFGGVLDENYRGEVLIILWNTNSEPLVYNAGAPIAQLVIIPIIHPTIVEVMSQTKTIRGHGALGSTHTVVDGVWRSTLSKVINE